MPDPLQEIIEELTYAIERTHKNQTTANYQLVQMKLSELSGALREMHQAMTQKKMKEIIKKLDKHAPLNQEEVRLIRDWIVGDAVSYTENERNFNAWLSLFDRLTKEVNVLYDERITPEKVLQVGALTQIAQKLVPNIIYYIGEKERIDRFDRAVSDGIDSYEAKAYKDILMAKMESTDY
jgi:hypothetical protein